jgi:hypothetical protein
VNSDPKPRRRTAHTPAQLAAALGWPQAQVARAAAAGVLPAHDMKTPRWSGPLVEAIEACAEEYAAAIPVLLDTEQMMQRLGLDRGAWMRGREHQLIPDPDVGVFWSQAAADQMTGRAAQIRDAIPPQPLGMTRCVQLLAEGTGLDVQDADLQVLIDRGLVEVVDYYKKWALYDVGALNTLLATEQGRQVIGEIVVERQAWIQASITEPDAARWLGGSTGDLRKAAADRDMKPGRFGRWARTDIAALSDDQDLVEQIRCDQLLAPKATAAHLDLRDLDLAHIREAGWVRPYTYTEMRVGRRSTVDVPLSRVGDLEAVLQQPGIDWNKVRETPAGERSALAEYVRLPIQRATAVRGFCKQLGRDYSVEVWPHWNRRTGIWEIDWEIRRDGHPRLEQVQDALADHPGASQHLNSVVLSTAVGEVIRWARDALEKGTAVIVDTETTGLGTGDVVIEIAVLDPFTEQVLLDTLVHPAGQPMSPRAQSIHQISDGALADAPPWTQIAPEFLAAVDGRDVIAYNADFDRARLIATHARAGLDPAQLPATGRWRCLMEARSTWYRTGRWLPLGGGHRARGDVQDALTVLRQLTAPAQ